MCKISGVREIQVQALCSIVVISNVCCVYPDEYGRFDKHLMSSCFNSDGFFNYPPLKRNQLVRVLRTFLMK